MLHGHIWVGIAVVILLIVVAGNHRLAAKLAVRGKTRNKRLKVTMKSQPKGTKLDIEFEVDSNGTYTTVGPNSKQFNTMAGTSVSRIPYYYPCWKDIPPEHKSTLFLELGTYFNLKRHLTGDNRTEVRQGLETYFGRLYKGQKSRFGKTWFDARGGLDNLDELKVSPPPDMPSDDWDKYIKFRTSDAFLARSAANKGCRDKQKIIVRHGRKTMAQRRYENRNPVTNEPADPIEEYRTLRTKNKQFTEEEAAKNYNDMVTARNDPNNSHLNNYEIVESVLKSRRGWIRGIGQKIPKYAGSSSYQQMYTQEEVNEILAKVMAEIGPIRKALENAGIVISDKDKESTTMDEGEDGDEDEDDDDDEDEDDEDDE